MNCGVTSRRSLKTLSPGPPTSSAVRSSNLKPTSSPRSLLENARLSRTFPDLPAIDTSPPNPKLLVASRPPCGPFLNVSSTFTEYRPGCLTLKAAECCARLVRSTLKSSTVARAALPSMTSWMMPAYHATPITSSAETPAESATYVQATLLCVSVTGPVRFGNRDLFVGASSASTTEPLRQEPVPFNTFSFRGARACPP